MFMYHGLVVIYTCIRHVCVLVFVIKFGVNKPSCVSLFSLMTESIRHLIEVANVNHFRVCLN